MLRQSMPTKSLAIGPAKHTDQSCHIIKGLARGNADGAGLLASDSVKKHRHHFHAYHPDHHRTAQDNLKKTMQPQSHDPWGPLHSNANKELTNSRVFIRFFQKRPAAAASKTNQFMFEQIPNTLQLKPRDFLVGRTLLFTLSQPLVAEGLPNHQSFLDQRMKETG